MTVRPIVPMADMSLGVSCAAFASVDDDARALGVDLVETMRASPACVGLAAPQIGIDMRAFALDCTAHPKTTDCNGELVVFNPVIVSSEGAALAREGCMSVPDLTGDVVRAIHVVLEGLDATGSEILIESSGFEARAIQHEIDHLAGLLFLDRLESPGALHQRRIYR